MKRFFEFKCFFIAIAMLSILCGCNKEPKSPSEVVLAAYMAANDGDYEKANNYVSSELLMMADMFTGGNSRSFWDEQTRNRAIKNIEITDEVITNDKAIVKFKFQYKEGDLKETEQGLEKINGLWKFSD